MPELIEITLDGRKLLVEPGKTILEVAEAQGIRIPALCSDRRLEPFASCWVCLVKVERAKGFVPSCATRVAPGMVVTTSSADVLAARRMALELLLSNHYGDCRAPCTLACPSNIDIQGYLGLAANGKFAEAVELIRRDNPLPAVIGRICPHPCETACRRNLVDEPLAINNVKRFVSDVERAAGGAPSRERPPRTGKRVAVVGAGPAGLSAAWYLGEGGVDVTLFEAQEKAGGMLRYGIPDYRLPPAVLDAGIRDILSWGGELRCGTALGRDITLAGLRKDFDAVLLALGAWKSRALRIGGEDHPAVLSGIDFLLEVNQGKPPRVGARTAVIGGGNTALDAARCSLRCGASEVTIYYRRTREEMPASDQEIEEALEEGVRIEYLVAPVTIRVDSGRLASLTLLSMELGEPDASGRRRPVPIDGSEHDVAVDTVISAVGQYPDTSVLKDLAGLLDGKGNLIVDAATGATPVDGVFAAGDLATGTDIAIRAIAGGKHAARSILQRFAGKPPSRPREFLSKKEDVRAPSADDFRDTPRIPRARPAVAAVEERKGSFAEIESTLPPDVAQTEAARCLECGCHDVRECLLKEHAGEYEAVAKRFLGAVEIHPVDHSHPFIARDPSKCILCGRCIRICLEVQGIGVLGYLYRGFTSLVAPSFGVPFGEDRTCISCGQCVSACPVGALTEKLPAAKNVPLEERVEQGICSLCSVGCAIEYRWHGTLFTRVVERHAAPNHGKLCRRGRFGHGFLNAAVPATPLGPGGEALTMEQARQQAERLLSASRRPLLRLSPRLSGESLDAFLAMAKRRGMAVEGVGLEGLDPRWAPLAEASAAPRSATAGAGAEPGAPRPIRVLVGDIASSNNVAFTEAFRARREGREQLWIVGAADEVAARTADRLEPELEALPATLQQAAAAGGATTVIVNPQALLAAFGTRGQELVLNALERAGHLVHLLWNDRNAGYLLERLMDSAPAERRRDEPDLLLVAGAWPETGDAPQREKPVNGAKIIAWGLARVEAALFVPLPRAMVIGGRSHPGGRQSITAGAIDEGEIGPVLLV